MQPNALKGVAYGTHTHIHTSAFTRSGGSVSKGSSLKKRRTAAASSPPSNTLWTNCARIVNLSSSLSLLFMKYDRLNLYSICDMYGMPEKNEHGLGAPRGPSNHARLCDKADYKKRTLGGWG